MARCIENEWLRVDTRNVDAVARAPHGKCSLPGFSLVSFWPSYPAFLVVCTSSGSSDQPNVAIISCLFIEKQAVDALIDDRSTVHKVCVCVFFIALLVLG